MIAPVDRIKDSEPSGSASFVTWVRTKTLVEPAAMVKPPAAETQLAPLKYSKAELAPVSTPGVAEPPVSTGVKVRASELALDRLTVNVNVPAASLTLRPVTLSVGVSSSVPPLPVPSSWIVPTPMALAMVALVGDDKVTLKDSLPSKTASFAIAIVIALVISWVWKVRVPAAAVKSLGDPALALLVA